MSRAFLIAGAVAGPIYVLTAAVQMLLRDGFDPTRHPVSLLSNGDLGWIQILNFVVAGSLVVASAAGLRSVHSTQVGNTWGPIMVCAFGIGLIASGIFVADPADGFPPGTPAGDPATVSFSGVMHFVTGGISFMSLIAACFVYARRFGANNRRVLGTFSALTGLFYFIAFAGIAAVPGPATVLLFTCAVVVGWAWLSAINIQALIEGVTSATEVRQPAL